MIRLLAAKRRKLKKAQQFSFRTAALRRVIEREREP